MGLQPIRAAPSSARISDLIWLLPHRNFPPTGGVTAIRVRTYSVALTSTAKSARQASTLAGTRRIGCASPCLRRRAWTGRVAGGQREERLYAELGQPKSLGHELSRDRGRVP